MLVHRVTADERASKSWVGGVLDSLRGSALRQVCWCLASADPAVRSSLFSRLSSSCCRSPRVGGGGGGGTATPSSLLAGVESSTGDRDSAGGGSASAAGGSTPACGGSVGIPSSVGDDILQRAGEMGCLTTDGVLELLRWCTPRVFSLEGVSSTVTDALLLRYPAKLCAMLEEVWLGWCPHLLEVEAFLLKIRRAGVDGQDDEPCALRCLDLSGNEGLSDGILKALAGRCPSLKVLRLDACPAITGAFLPRLAQGCPSLTHLSAEASTGLTDSAVATFIMESQAVSSGALRSLRLGGCPVGSLSAQALLMRGACLRELHLDGCPSLGDAAVGMLCRACPGLLELSLLGCSALTCRGAWQCTQHPSVETLAITLTLLPFPGLIPPERRKATRARRQRGKVVVRGVQSGGGGGEGGDASGPTLRGRPPQWACERCTCLSAERKSTCQACRAPRGSDLPPPSPQEDPPPPRPSPPLRPAMTTSSPSSPRLSPSLSPLAPPSPPPLVSSPSGGRQGRGRSPSSGLRGRSNSGSPRSPPTRKEPSPHGCVPLPLPTVPPSAALRRLNLELAAAPPEVVEAAVAAEAAAADGDATGGGGGDRAGRGYNPSTTGSSAARFASASSSSPSSSSSSMAVKNRCAFPLRRLAPLLPPGLVSLDIWSSNASPVPRSVLQEQQQQRRRQQAGSRGIDDLLPSRGSTRICLWGGGGGGSEREWAGRNPQVEVSNVSVWRGRARGRSGGSWRASSAAVDGGEGAPAFETVEPKIENRGGVTSDRVGGPGTGASWSDGKAPEACSEGVAVLAAPGDLMCLSEACPSLQELVIAGDPTQHRATPAVRIRGRGENARETSITAGVHATAAAVAYFFRTSALCASAGSGSSAAAFSAAAPLAAAAAAAAAPHIEGSPTRSPLRVLAVFDCPSLPPLAILEAVATEGGAGLERVAVGCSKPAVAAAAQRTDMGEGGGTTRRGGKASGAARASGLAVATRNDRVAEVQEGQLDDEIGRGWGSGGGGGVDWEGRGGTRGNVEQDADVDVDAENEGVTLSSETLKGLHVFGAAGLTRVTLRCPRLEKLELVNCSLLGGIEMPTTPTLTEARLENCRLGNKGLVPLVKACWRLETLDVSGNPSVGDPVVTSALAECPRLKTLDASGCRDVGGSSLFVPFLRSLAVTSAPAAPSSLRLTPPPPPPLLSAPTQRRMELQELVVSNAPSLTGAHVAAMSKGLPLLRRLSISSCRGLIDVVPECSGRQGYGRGGFGDGRGLACISEVVRGGDKSTDVGGREGDPFESERGRVIGAAAAAATATAVVGDYHRLFSGSVREEEEDEGDEEDEEDEDKNGEREDRAAEAVAETGVVEGSEKRGGGGKNLARADTASGSASGREDQLEEEEESERGVVGGGEGGSDSDSGGRNGEDGGAIRLSGAPAGVRGGGNDTNGLGAARESFHAESEESSDPETGCADGIGESDSGRAHQETTRYSRKKQEQEQEEQEEDENQERAAAASIEGAGKRWGRRRRRKPSVCSLVEDEADEGGGDSAAAAGKDDVGGDSSRAADGTGGALGGSKDKRRERGGGKRGGKGGERRMTRREARDAEKKLDTALRDDAGVREVSGKRGGGGGGGGRKGRRGDVLEDKGQGRRKEKEEDRGGGEDQEDGDDACQGMEFRVDGKTRVKLERLAAALPREPGRKKIGRPSCIRFLQGKCPRSAGDCAWAHLPMHPPKTIKFKPLLTHAQEPSPSACSSSSSMSKRGMASHSHSQPAPAPAPAPLPPPPSSKSPASASGSTAPCRSAGDGSGVRGGDASNVSSLAYAMGGEGGIGGGGGAGRARASPVLVPEVDIGQVGDRRGGGGGAELLYFENLQFLEFHSCSGLKRLEGLKCPALAAASVTSCRELVSVRLEGASVLNHLDFGGCVRLERWELLPASPSPASVGSGRSAAAAAAAALSGTTGLGSLRVVILNYCRALQPKSLALLVDQARDLRRLEIYGAAVVAQPRPHGGTSGKAKKEQTGGKRGASRLEYNRMVSKAAAIIKGLDKGRPKLKIIRTKKEFSREQDRM